MLDLLGWWKSLMTFPWGILYGFAWHICPCTVKSCLRYTQYSL